MERQELIDNFNKARIEAAGLSNDDLMQKIIDLSKLAKAIMAQKAGAESEFLERAARDSQLNKALQKERDRQYTPVLEKETIALQKMTRAGLDAKTAASIWDEV